MPPGAADQKSPYLDDDLKNGPGPDRLCERGPTGRIAEAPEPDACNRRCTREQREPYETRQRGTRADERRSDTDTLCNVVQCEPQDQERAEAGLVP
jgi:hypothetical protein